MTTSKGLKMTELAKIRVSIFLDPNVVAKIDARAASALLDRGGWIKAQLGAALTALELDEKKLQPKSAGRHKDSIPTHNKAGIPYAIYIPEVGFGLTAKRLEADMGMVLGGGDLFLGIEGTKSVRLAVVAAVKKHMASLGLPTGGAGGFHECRRFREIWRGGQAMTVLEAWEMLNVEQVEDLD